MSDLESEFRELLGSLTLEELKALLSALKDGYEAVEELLSAAR